MKPVIRTLYSFLSELNASTPDKPLLGGPGGWMSVVQIFSRVANLAAAFSRQGIGPGTLTVLPAQRTPEWAICLLALNRVGAMTVLTDPRQDSSVFLSACEPAIQIQYTIQVDGTHLTLWPGEQRLDLNDLPPSGELPQEPDPREPAFLIFTSGSTGRPKAVMLSAYNLINNLVDSAPLGCYHPADIALGALPMDHVFGLVLLAGICVLGYSIYFPGSTDVPALLASIEQQRITRMNGVPSLYLAMAEQAASYDLSSLRAGFIGGSPCTPEQFAFLESTLGMTLIGVYGMSECVGIACGNFRNPQDVRAQGVGPFYSMNTGKLLREDGTEAAPEEIGEIHVTGPSRMVGYYPNKLAPEALFPTGDLGYLDKAGTLHLTGRKKDIIIRNGNNLSPRRIEEALLSIPGVTQAAVVGLPDDAAGEVPWAMILCPENSLRRIWIELATRLPKNELPVELVRTEAMPLTPSGKPDKQKIREVLMQCRA